MVNPYYIYGCSVYYIYGKRLLHVWLLNLLRLWFIVVLFMVGITFMVMQRQPTCFRPKSAIKDFKNCITVFLYTFTLSM